MEFDNEFAVKAPVEEVWSTLLEVERVAPCVPGAEVLERIDEDKYKVGIKVKLGPMSMQYQGTVEIVERDESAHRAVMRVETREMRGQGTANATTELGLASDDGATHGKIHTDVQVRGRAASMGRGVMQDVATKLVDAFSENLEEMLAGEPVGAAAAATPAPTAAVREAAPAGDSAEAPGAEPASASPGPTAAPDAAPDVAERTAAERPAAERPEPSRKAAEALDVGSLAGSVASDRLRDPRVVVAVIGIVAGIAFLLGRRSR